MCKHVALRRVVEDIKPSKDWMMIRKKNKENFD